MLWVITYDLKSRSNWALFQREMEARGWSYHLDDIDAGLHLPAATCWKEFDTHSRTLIEKEIWPDLQAAAHHTDSKLARVAYIAGTGIWAWE